MDIDVIIETPQGSRNKYEMEYEGGRIRLDRMLFTSTRYPADYGLVPGTLALDGDPLDTLVLLAEPAFPGMHGHGPHRRGVLYAGRARPGRVGSDRPGARPSLQCRAGPGGCPAHLLAEISHFFEVYKELEPGKSSDVRGWQDRAAAEQEISAAFERGRSGAPAGRQHPGRQPHPPPGRARR